MQHHQIAARFDRVFNGEKNFLTPNVLSYGKAGRLLWELSTGEGIEHEPIYGVTVINVDGGREHDLSGCFHSRAEAEEHIRQKIKGIS